MKFRIVSLGCKVNSYESEAILNDFVSRGLEYTEQNNADVIIINTCTVTSTSDQKSRQIIRKLKRENPASLIVAMGCYVQLHQEEASELADVIIGTNNRLKAYDIVKSYLDTKSSIEGTFKNNNFVDDIDNVTEYEEMKVNAVKTHTRGFVKIQDGCENYCSYCAIPYARGKIRSRKPDDVINEIKTLVKNGTHEVIIAGINTGTYGQDLGNIDLAKLIERIMIETTLFRLRLSSIELMEVSDELLNTIKKYETRIAHHLHIPLQGGSDAVLKRMHRKYLTNDYRKLIGKIRVMFPRIAITTDLLAGFVGETEEEFNETCSFIKEMNFSMMHIFPYSRRKNTEADKMPGHLDPKVINERAHILLDIAKKMQIEYEKSFINENCTVITEQVKNGYYVSHSSNYLEIYIPTNKELKENMIIDVKITKFDNNRLIGEIIEIKERN